MLMEKSEVESLCTHILWLSLLEEQGTYTAAARKATIA